MAAARVLLSLLALLAGVPARGAIAQAPVQTAVLSAIAAALSWLGFRLVEARRVRARAGQPPA